MDTEELKAFLAPAVGMTEPPVETPAPEPTVETPEPTQIERDASGRFAAKADDAPVSEAGTNEPPLTKNELAGVLHALSLERDKRKAVEAERDSLRSQAEPKEPPTQDQILDQRLRSVTLTASRKFADREYGKELLAKVHDWAVAKCDADPSFNSSMMSDDDPYEKAVQAYNREQIAAEVQSPDDLAAFKAWKAAQANPPATATPIPPKSTPPPRSLVNAPGNGSAGVAAVSVSPDAAYMAAFPR